MKKVLCIYHSVDLDGWMSAAITKLWAEKKEFLIDFIGWNYGDDISDVSGYDYLVMCDISFPIPKMKELICDQYKNNFVYIDHHISAINAISEIEDQPLGFRDTKYAACELSWLYFFNQDEMPEIVRLLGRYDCFGHKGTEEEEKVLIFQYGARANWSNYKDCYLGLVSHPEFWENELLDQGRSIYKYLKTEAKQAYQKKFTVEFVELKNNNETFIRRFLCVNKERFNPINFGIDYHKDGYDGTACFWYNGDKWAFSLYNDNGEVDCSTIAKDFGGGGHKGAAGFIVDYDKLKLIFENKVI